MVHVCLGHRFLLTPNVHITTAVRAYCTYMQVPSPKEISDEQLATMLESGDASQYRVPISLGEPHTVHDNSECLSYWSPSILAMSSHSQPGKSAVPLMWLWVQRSLSPFRCVCVGVWAWV